MGPPRWAGDTLCGRGLREPADSNGSRKPRLVIHLEAAHPIHRSGPPSPGVGPYGFWEIRQAPPKPPRFSPPRPDCLRLHTIAGPPKRGSDPARLGGTLRHAVHGSKPAKRCRTGFDEHVSHDRLSHTSK